MQAIKTLIVDDEEMIRNGIARMIRNCGEIWEVVAALSDGKEALDFLQRSEEPVDLLITDVRMPELDGLTLIHEGKQYHSFLPLVVSGYDDFQYVQTALREGAIDYILKPIDRDQFRERIESIRTKIDAGRTEHMKWTAMEKNTEKLKNTQQIQLLSYVTSAGLDIAKLGYWVDIFPAGGYSLLYISLDAPPEQAQSYTVKDWEAFAYVLENIITELVVECSDENGGQGWCWRGSDSNFWALLQCPQTDPELETVKELSRRIRSSVQLYTPFTVSVSCGDVMEDLYLLPEAKKQAESMMHYRLLYGGNQWFQPHTLRLGISSSDDPLESELISLIQRMKLAVEQINEGEALQLCEELFTALRSMNMPQAISQTVQNAYILIHSISLERHLALQPVGSLEEGLQAIKRAADLKRLKREIEWLIIHIIRGLRTIKQSVGIETIEQAKAWISANLEENLTIKRIADHVFLNPSYFCRMFKMQTGETVLDYVTGLRMSKAKELLANQQLKLYDISSQIGYQDVKYFSRLFKQWVGHTPSKYRELLFGQEQSRP